MMEMLADFGFGAASPLLSIVLLIGCMFVARGLHPPVKKDKDR
jgi:hypothetical protein